VEITKIICDNASVLYDTYGKCGAFGKNDVTSFSRKIRSIFVIRFVLGQYQAEN